MKKIITLQHAQSIHHTNGMVGSWTDWDLSELGKRQADNIGRRLTAELAGERYVMYSSDLLRARHTAEAVGAHMGITPMLARELRERNLGKCVGKSAQWLRENMECHERTVDNRMFSDAESRRDVWNRLLTFYDMLLDGADENIILVSHGDLLSTFNAMWLGMDVEMLERCSLFGLAGGVSFMLRDAEGKHVIKRLSDMSYINELANP